MAKITLHIAAAVTVFVLLAGCDPISRHKVLSTVFDGVPTLPPPEQICTEYADLKLTAFKEELAGAKKRAEAGDVSQGSVHLPYDEKKCDNCHDKNKDDGLVRPAKQLCLMCHKDFFQGHFQHGPAAVGDCLSCHLPHNSAYTALLKTDRKVICDTCHKEQRAALSLHNKVAERKLDCADCHNPHYGTTPFFLK